jgi:hypothetical protein
MIMPWDEVAAWCGGFEVRTITPTDPDANFESIIHTRNKKLLVSI